MGGRILFLSPSHNSTFTVYLFLRPPLSSSLLLYPPLSASFPPSNLIRRRPRRIMSAFSLSTCRISFRNRLWRISLSQRGQLAYWKEMRRPGHALRSCVWTQALWKMWPQPSWMQGASPRVSVQQMLQKLSVSWLEHPARGGRLYPGVMIITADPGVTAWLTRMPFTLSPPRAGVIGPAPTMADEDAADDDEDEEEMEPPRNFDEYGEDLEGPPGVRQNATDEEDDEAAASVVATLPPRAPACAVPVHPGSRQGGQCRSPRDPAHGWPQESTLGHATSNFLRHSSSEQTGTSSPSSCTVGSLKSINSWQYLEGEEGRAGWAGVLGVLPLLEFYILSPVSLSLSSRLFYKSLSLSLVRRTGTWLR